VAEPSTLRHTFHLNGAPTNYNLNEIFHRISRALRAVEGRHGVARIRAPLIIEVSSDDEEPITIINTTTNTTITGGATEQYVDDAVAGRPLRGDGTRVWWRDEFVGGHVYPSVGETNFVFSTAGAGIIQQFKGVSYHPGIVSIKNAAGDGANTVSYMSHHGGEHADQFGTLTFWFRALTSGTKADVQIGVHNDWSDGYSSIKAKALLQSASGDSNWFSATGDNSSLTTKDTGVAYATGDWVKGAIVFNGTISDGGTGTWDFYLNDVLVSSHGFGENTPNNPGVNHMAAGMAIYATGSGDESRIEVDLMDYYSDWVGDRRVD
jgi:hypothetical protein